MEKNRAFTLIELLAVIVILGVLLLIAVPAVTNLINNYKKKAFIADCHAYLEAAKYNNSLSDQTQPQYFNIKNLDVDKTKEQQIGGVLFFDPDEDGKNEYYIYVYDKELGFSIGTNEYKNIGYVSENDISYSNLFEVPGRFENDIEGNFIEGTSSIYGNVNKTNFEFNVQDNELVNKSYRLELGELVYVPKKDQRGEYSCQVMTVLSNSVDKIVLFDSNSVSIGSFSRIREKADENQINLQYSYYIKKYVDIVRLFSVNDLYYFANFDKYGFTSELFEANKASIANLFSPLSPDSFYKTESKYSRKNRFISLGNYSKEDRCRVDGTIGDDASVQCYSFDLSGINSGHKPVVSFFDPYTDPILYNYVVVINSFDYVGYNTVNQDGNQIGARASCEEKLKKLQI